jgi:hypothetical protein
MAAWIRIRFPHAGPEPDPGDLRRDKMQEKTLIKLREIGIKSMKSNKLV